MAVVKHCIRVSGNTGMIRQRIEYNLDVNTSLQVLGDGWSHIYFEAEEDVDLDFLRPDVLPPVVT